MIINFFSYSQDINIKPSLVPLNILNPNQPYLTGGLEIVIKEKIGLEINYGKRILPYGFLFEKPYEVIVTPYKGEKFQLEAKIYNVIDKKFYSVEHQQTYIGLGYRQVNDLRNLAIIYWVPNNYNSNFQTSKEHTAIKKRVVAVNIILGIVTSYKRISFDGSLMVGIKKKSQNYIDNEYYQLGYNSFQHWVWDVPMNAYRPSLNMRFKIAYKLL